MSESDGTHLVVCKSEEALQYLENESILLGLNSRKEKLMSQGDALVARDILTEAGFEWGKDFYLKKIKD